MRRYLTLSEIEAALNRGKQVEQFPGHSLEDRELAIRSATIRRDDENFVVTVYKRFEAVSSLVSQNVASAERFVKQVLVGKEYKDYRNAAKS